MKLTYRQIHKLLDKGVEMFVDSPTGKKKILNKFSKMSEGYIIKYDDNTETNCAVAHNMIFNGVLKGASEIQVGDVDYLSHKKVISKTKIPEQEYLDFEISDPNGLYIQNGIIHHNSGKSLGISLILEFFRRKGLKGILVVPNINLLTQFRSDIESYGLKELLDEVQLLGNGNESDFKTTVTITTWQSMIDHIKEVKPDFIICDEVHKESGDVVSSILKESMNTKIKLGFTGTLPEDPIAKMTLLGLFGEPYTVITAKELIQRGLATPVKIKSVFLNYTKPEITMFRELKDYQKQLKYIKDHEKRLEIILKIALGMRQKDKNTLILYQHTEHGKQIYSEIFKKLFPGEELTEKDLTGKNAFEFQKDHNLFFMNGEVKGHIREKQRNLLEEVSGSILIAPYQVMSTGVNLRNLHFLILASPLKAFTTISQSLGRLMRKHPSKTEAIIFDIVDNLGKNCIFMKQYKHRVEASYIPEEFEIQRVDVNV